MLCKLIKDYNDAG